MIENKNYCFCIIGTDCYCSKENGHNRYQEQNSEGKEDLRSDKKRKRSQEEEEETKIMATRCLLICLENLHPPILLPHNLPRVVGRSKETKIKSKRCSKSQGERHR